jgi:IstB-like ATP binding protein
LCTGRPPIALREPVSSSRTATAAARSTIVTSQFPVDQWHALIGDPTYARAVLDRLLGEAQPGAVRRRPTEAPGERSRRRGRRPRAGLGVPRSCRGRTRQCGTVSECAISGDPPFIRCLQYKAPACLEQALRIRTLPMKRTDRALIDHLTREEIQARLVAPTSLPSATSAAGRVVLARRLELD